MKLKQFANDQDSQRNTLGDASVTLDTDAALPGSVDGEVPRR